MASEGELQVEITSTLLGEGMVPHRVVDRGAWWSADNPVLPDFWAIGSTRSEAVGRLIRLGREVLGSSPRPA
jgi:hypothetical protein